MRRLAISSACAMGGAAYPFFVEPRWLEVTTHQIAHPGLRPGTQVRILHLTDLHASVEVPFSVLEEAAERGVAEQPDVVCLTGDYITRELPGDLTRYRELLSRLSAAAPTFAVLGNHDGGEWALRMGGYPSGRWVTELLESAGIVMLQNRNVRIVVRGVTLDVAGVGDLWSREVDVSAAFRGLESKAANPVVLLSHNPDSKDTLGEAPWDLMLSGHTHGGQVKIPGWGPPIVPVRDRRFVEGLHAWRGRQIYVSRGVGGILLGVRFACRPEAAILNLHSPLEAAAR